MQFGRDSSSLPPRHWGQSGQSSVYDFFVCRQFATPFVQQVLRSNPWRRTSVVIFVLIFTDNRFEILGEFGENVLLSIGEFAKELGQRVYLSFDAEL